MGGGLQPRWVSPGKAAPVPAGRIHLQRGGETSPNLGTDRCGCPKKALREGFLSVPALFWHRDAFSWHGGAAEDEDEDEDEDEGCAPLLPSWRGLAGLAAGRTKQPRGSGYK